MRPKQPYECAPPEKWFKSSYSGSHGECVEVANLEAGAAVRDTKHRELGALTFDRPEWHAFIRGTKNSRQ